VGYIYIYQPTYFSHSFLKEKKKDRALSCSRKNPPLLPIPFHSGYFFFRNTEAGEGHLCDFVAGGWLNIAFFGIADYELMAWEAGPLTRDWRWPSKADSGNSLESDILGLRLRWQSASEL